MKTCPECYETPCICVPYPFPKGIKNPARDLFKPTPVQDPVAAYERSNLEAYRRALRAFPKNYDFEELLRGEIKELEGK
jgi:hypothetical protein